MNLSSIRRTLSPLVAAIALVAGSAQAGVVYQQAPGAGFGSGWTSQFGIGQGGFQSFDNFKTTSDATIDRVTWRGAYLTADAAGLKGASANTDTWTVEFWSGNAAGPTTQLYSQDYAVASVKRSYVTTVDPGGFNAELYDYALDLTLDFDVTAGEQYWFSVMSKASTFSPFFSWTSAVTSGSTYQRLYDGNGRVIEAYDRFGDRAFSLESSAVPEPASLALVAGALLAAGVSSRRRRAA